jgi:hypothetical protein
MATLLLPTSLPPGSPAAVPFLHKVPTSLRPTSPPSVRAKDRRDDERLQNRQNRIVEMLPLVKRLAFKIHQHLPSQVEMDDLVANGVLGLINAVRKVDAGKRVKFERYAQPAVRASSCPSACSRACSGRIIGMETSKKPCQNFSSNLSGRPVPYAKFPF